LSKLPTQLKWSQFVAALKQLKYRELASKGGSARHFERLSDKVILTFHQPHGNNTIPTGTLSEYLRKLGLTREELDMALRGRQGAEIAEEDRFRRSVDSDGTIISNCSKCLEVVTKSKIEDVVLAAETAHSCYPAPIS
jgi:predicted RNA binding protein YcfA (HicA-like mRNA interferase family)